ncbi:unnamed protein product [Gongylonema pulchrum]|uniref:Glycosyl transferase n=1 Tax=Gongylonema pulchrum TaxID=637853 RepID=A0A183EB97_9BILA|nr:unnamed protein product [Gongylonema pulchrum]
MRQDVMCVDDEMLLHCFEHNCAYGMWQTKRFFPDEDLWPESEMMPPRGQMGADCNWILAQFSSMVRYLPA